MPLDLTNQHHQVLEKFLNIQRNAHHMSPCTVRGYQWKLGALFEAWRDKDMPSWDYADWEDYLAANPDWGPRTIKKVASHAAKFISWCKARKMDIGDFLEGYQPPKDKKTEVACAKPEDVRTLLKHAKGRMKVAIALAAYCGARRNEINTITWAAYSGSHLDTYAPKTKKRRRIPRNSVVREILDAHREEELAAGRGKDTDEIVHWPCFGGTSDNGNRDLNLLQDKCGTPRHGWHAFRHHFGTQLVRAHVDLGNVQGLMGHATLEVTSRYVHSTPADQISAVEALVA